MAEIIHEFDGEFRFLSNFYIAGFTWGGYNWPHSEGAFQAAKTLDRNKWLEFLPLTPGQAKRKGRQVVMRADWEQVKVEVMMEIIYAKFTQNPDLLQKLIDTNNAQLIEGNTWGDRFWGVSPPRSNNGHNFLGRLLEELRAIYTGKCSWSNELVTF